MHPDRDRDNGWRSKKASVLAPPVAACAVPLWVSRGRHAACGGGVVKALSGVRGLWRRPRDAGVREARAMGRWRSLLWLEFWDWRSGTSASIPYSALWTASRIPYWHTRVDSIQNTNSGNRWTWRWSVDAHRPAKDEAQMLRSRRGAIPGISSLARTSGTSQVRIPP